jgi:hypothetical protein
MAKAKQPEKTPEKQVAAARVMDKLTDDGGKGVFAKLPLASSLYNSTVEMQNAIDALKMAHSVKEQIEKLNKGEGGLESLKEEITAIAVGAEVPGYRHGNLAVAVSVVQSARFDKEMFRDSLITAGVDPEMVKQLYDEAHMKAEPYYRVDLRKIGWD